MSFVDSQVPSKLSWKLNSVGEQEHFGGNDVCADVVWYVNAARVITARNRRLLTALDEIDADAYIILILCRSEERVVTDQPGLPCREGNVE